jgi:acetolactate synthase-1/2/3 large subunit
MPTGAELFVQSCVRLGLTEIFTLVGDHLNLVLAEADKAGLRIIDMRHESGVTHAADAWARIHRRPALALVTGGPGHTNALTGVATAQLAGSPLILVSGARNSMQSHRGAFQDIDQVGMARPVTKWAAEANHASRIPHLLARAYAQANSGRRGAVHLSVPVDVFDAEVSSQPTPGVSTALPVADISRIEEELSRAERPVVIAGSGAWWSDAGEELQAFIESADVPLYTITMARGLVRDDHPLCMGYADPSLNRAALEVCKRADLVVVLGKRVDFRLAFGGARVFSPEARFAQVDIDPSEFGTNRAIDVAVCSDLKRALRPVRGGDRSEWLAFVRDARARWQASLDQATGEPAAYYREIRRHLPADARISWDGGDFVHWGRCMVPALVPGGWMRLGPLATIGAALPNAIAMKAASPDTPVVLITGDGAFGFYIAEIDTAVRHKIPFVIIVGNDGAWGLEQHLQTAVGREVACQLRQTRYDLVVKGFGGDGETVDSPDQIAAALHRGFASGVPYCVNINLRAEASPFAEWQLAGKQVSGGSAR